MQGSSLLTVKHVATALGIDERSVRDKLTLGTLKGTKRTIGNKEQWFVHQRDLDAELARRGLSPINQYRQTTQQQVGANQLHFQQPVVDGPQTAVYQANAFNGVQPAQVTIQPPEVASGGAYVSEVSSGDIPVDESDAVIAEVTEAVEPEKETSGGDRLGWHNEDMQKQLMATAEVFMKPLIERIEALTAADREKDAELKAKDKELEEARNQLKLLPDLQAQKAKLLNEIEAERQAAEIQFAKAREQEGHAQLLAEENERLKKKAEEATLSAAKLEELEKVVQELQKPKPGFWQKVFGTAK